MNEGTTYAELRAAITECLRIERPHSHAPLSVDTLIHDVAEIAARRQMKHDTGAGVVDAWHQNYSGPVLHDVLRAQLADIVWDLIIEGILRPGDGKDAKDALSRMPYLHLTAHGRKTLDDPTTPYDPAGYLKRLKDDVPGIDKIILTYMAESIETLRRSCLLSSTVTMGCASEQAMLLLIEKTAEAFGPANRPAFELAMFKLRSIKQQNEEYRKWFDSHLRARLKADKGADWISEMENALQLMFNYFRIVRNDAGHPTGTKVSREEATAHLVLFPHYLRLVYDLIEWLDSHKPV